MLSLSSSIFAQSAKTKTMDSTKKVLIVEASCGECQFKMKGKGCTLAIRIEGKSYFVEKANLGGNRLESKNEFPTLLPA